MRGVLFILCVLEDLNPYIIIAGTGKLFSVIFGMYKVTQFFGMMGCIAQLVAPQSHGFSTQTGHLLSLLLPLIQEGLKYVHLVLVNGVGALCLHRNGVVLLTDCPDMTIAANSGCKGTKQKQQNNFSMFTITELQIRGSIEDNSKIIFLISQ